MSKTLAPSSPAGKAAGLRKLEQTKPSAASSRPRAAFGGPLSRTPLLFALVALPVSQAFAAPVDFVRDVRPIFQKHCEECHGGEKQRSGLRLDIKSEALKGGDNHGPDILPGNARDSPLVRFITSEDKDERMPPRGGLSPAEIETIVRWIDEGALWPDGVDTAKLEDKTDHWAFKPLRETRPPGAPGPEETAGPDPKRSAAVIDSFIDARLSENGLRRSPPADPVAWLRRVTFDLTGLPPTPEEAAAFEAEVAAGKPDAFEAVVERLLASPRYGERQAQHWLDVVRFADTHGFEVNTERPNAWPYRDYVIQAFNADLPYDEFIRHQIAGDVFPCQNPGIRNHEAATGFLVTASVLLPGQIGQDDASKRLARQDAIDEIVVNIGQTFLGLSVGCARCHDHKFDPVTARDYYAMQAFVAGVEYEERELQTPEAVAARAEIARLKEEIAGIDKELFRLAPVANSGVRRPMVNARVNHDRFPPLKARGVRFTILETNNLEPCVDELEVFDTVGENIALKAEVTVSGETAVPNRHDWRFVNDGVYGNSSSWMSNEKGRGRVALLFDGAREIDRVVWGRDRLGEFADRLATRYVIEALDESGEWKVVADSGDRLPFDPEGPRTPVFSTQGLNPEEADRAKALLEKKRPMEAKLRRLEAERMVFAGVFREPDDIRLLNRGDPEQPREPVDPAVPVALGNLKLSRETPESERRRALAEWIASPENPLTARVMVNRVWQGHFGTGLVETPSDFGRSGAKPTHPELLDWLAAAFIRSGWSVKHLHRMIVLSETYRQSGAIGQDANARAGLAADAESRLLWRFPSRRLEAEAIRDSMLAVSGLLNTKMYGRGYDLFDKRGGLSGFNPVESFTGDGLRRMIYAHKVRREPEAVFGAFDCPDAGQSTAVRRVSTTPIQALNLFNSRFTLDAANALAERARREAGDDLAAQIARVYRLALCRTPDAEEIADVEPAVRDHGLAVLCRAIFNCNEFLFIP